MVEKYSTKSFVKDAALKLWSLISLKPAFLKTTESESFKPERKKRLIGALKNT